MLGVILFLHKIKKNKRVQQSWDKAERRGQNAPINRVQANVKLEMVVYTREANSSPVEMPDNEATACETNAHKERTELESMERSQEIGQTREKMELTSSPGISGRWKYS